MPVRLQKVAKEVNVGVSRLAEFLRKKNIMVEDDPNTKVTDEAYELLWKEFGHGEMPKREEKTAPVVEKPKEEEVKPLEPEPAKEEELTPVEEPERPHFKVLGKIDEASLSPSKKNKKEKAAPAEEEEQPTKSAPLQQEADIPQPEAQGDQVAAPFQEVPIEVPVKPEPTPQPVPQAEVTEVATEPEPEEASDKSEDKAPETVSQEAEKTEPQEPEIFSLSHKLTTNIKVVSTIDLDAINQFTRPKKKSKQEKQKEQEERRQRELAEKKQRAEAAKSGRPDSGSEAAGASGDAEKNQPKKKRSRIRDSKIRIESNSEFSSGSYGSERLRDAGKSGRHGKKPVLKSEVSDEDVSRQIKETLARLSSKPKKGVKYRKEKREAVSMRQHEMEEREALESNIIKITEFVTVNDLASMMNVPVVQVISKCMEMGQMVSINQRLDAETINIVADEFGFTTEYVSAEVMQAIHEDEDKEEDLVPRPPIITVMGHVDHGKTSLLDYIRNANVIAGEAGGITQHIGAYSVTLDDGREITFLDTPGHEAFTAMRARGAKLTDIAIIIVAADDNVMPQTVEAINHASNAGVPIVFAINKIDKPTADPERIKQELAEMNYLVEDWGGKYQSQDISAKKGLNVKELLDKVLLEAELLDLKANPNRRAVGSIIESSLDKGRGYIATVLVQNGTLKIGDIMVAGIYHGRVKAMFNERGQKIETAHPGQPALILGLNGAPQAGDNFNVLETEQEAREVASKREQLQREQGLRTGKILTLAEIGRRIAVGNFRELNIIVKGDVDGSVEALSDSLIELSTEQIQVNIIHKAVGQISESDVTLASASDAIIVGFQVRPSLPARRMAEHEGVDIRLYSVIYAAIEEVKAAMEGLLSPEIKEEILGSAEVREIFKISKVGTVAGCMVKDGKIKRGCKVRLIRDGIVIYTGDLDSLKRFKDDAKEVTVGFECGMSIVGYNDIKVGDYIESFEEHEVKQSL